MLSKGVRRAVAAVAAAVAVAAAPVQAQNAFQQGLEAYLSGDYEKALALWQPAAGSGDAVAAFNIGVLYAQGLGVQADLAEAVRWYRQSATAGYANAQFNLGAAYFNGEGTEVNISQAVSWWEKAAEQDHPEALYNLGTLYRQGKGVEQDFKRAITLFERSAALGDSRAQQALAGMDAGASEAAQPVESETERSRPDESGGGGTGVALSQEDPSRWTVQIFAATEREAAERFARDHGLTGPIRIYRARVEGKTWYKGIYGSYADEGAARAAQTELQKKLPGSSPWLRSFKAIQAEAVGDEILTASAESPPQGAETPESPDDQSRKTGNGQAGGGTVAAAGTEPGPGNEAATGETREAGGGEQKTASAAPASGEEADQSALRQGQKAFNAQDYNAAMAAWRSLAEKGVAEAQYGVGFMYESGWGVDRDYDEAFRWYQRAAQQGHVKSQYNLGMLYRNGQGVAQNDALGLYWIQTAADRGDERAVTYLKNLN